jgi:hypothetical protein
MLSWITPDKWKPFSHPQRKRKRPGRPKELEDAERIDIIIDKGISEALKKVPNKSKFIRDAIRPILEQLDPGAASVFLWRIDFHLYRGIVKAVQKGDFKQVNALSWLATCLEDARKLCGVPPRDLDLLSTEEVLGRKQAFQDFIKIRDIIIEKGSELEMTPEATYNCLNTYPFLKGKMKPEFKELVEKINWAYRINEPDPFRKRREVQFRLRKVALETVRNVILPKVFEILHESES